MKKIITILLILMTANVFATKEYPITTSEPTTYELQPNEVVIPKQHLLDIMSLLEDYDSLRGKIKDSDIRDVRITKIDTGTYKMTMMLDNYKLNVIFTINEEDVIELQRKLNRLRTTKPIVTKEWIDEDKRILKLTMQVDDVKWSSTITIHQIKATFSWHSFFKGYAAGAGTVGLIWLCAIII